MEDFATKGGHADKYPNNLHTGHALELEWLHKLDADAARQVLMNIAGLILHQTLQFVVYAV